MANFLSYLLHNIKEERNEYSIDITVRELFVYYKDEMKYSRLHSDNRYIICDHVNNLCKLYRNNILVAFQNYKYCRKMYHNTFVIYINKDKILGKGFPDRIIYFYKYINSIQYKIEYKFDYIFECKHIIKILINKYVNNYRLFIYKPKGAYYIQYKQPIILIYNKYELQYYSKYFQCL